MAEAGTSGLPPLLVGLPEALGRRMRLGPFPSAHHALKFAAYAAIGGAVAAAVGAVWTLPFVGVGFLLSVYQPDGRALDGQVGEYLQFRWRIRPSATPPDRRPAEPEPGGPFLTSVPGHLVAIVAVRGLPVAFLPPMEARSLFDSYRMLLRTLERGAIVHMGVEPISERPFVPRAPKVALGGPEDSARRGYSEMIRLLCRRRYRRRVWLALWEPVGPRAALQLNGEVERVVGHLGRLGLDAVRLREGPLRAAAAQIGWSGGGAA